MKLRSESQKKLLKKPAKKWKIAGEPEYEWHFDHKHAVPVADIMALKEEDWAGAVGVEKSAAGSEGVFFVDLGPAESEGGRSESDPGRKAVIIKMPSTVACEMFGTLIARRMGIATPRCKLVPAAGDEGLAIVAALTKLDAQRPQHARTFERSKRKPVEVLERCTATAWMLIVAPCSAIS